MVAGLWTLVGLAALALGMVAASGAADNAKDLEKIQSKIESEKRNISRVKTQEASVLQALGQIQNELHKRNQQLKAVESKLQSLTREVARMEARARQIEASIGRRQELLRERALALYRWHRGASPFVILNGDFSWGQLLRRRHYLEATVSYDRQLLRALDEEAQEQRALGRELTSTRREMGRKRTELHEAQESVRNQADKKRELLARLRSEKVARVQALKELEQAAFRLQKMMEEISRRAISKPTGPSSGSGLSAMRGRLEWPVKGEVKSEFGVTRHPQFAANVFHKGIAIEAPLGAEVKSVERGTVVYAGQFSGYGNLVIVDHGDRYYTIYAHLSEIFKSLGEVLKRGETLGLAGETDSFAGVRLYFEMRKDGRSIDPLPWLRKP